MGFAKTFGAYPDRNYTPKMFSGGCLFGADERIMRSWSYQKDEYNNNNWYYQLTPTGFHTTGSSGDLAYANGGNQDA